LGSGKGRADEKGEVVAPVIGEGAGTSTKGGGQNILAT